ncbi:methyl-accepting chemotaxis protein [Candidatus Reidiella endopervernicosa]|uniref:MCP four helix bundle domain-containing protein n=1 Tax=Candidatus Reidiella endopervernicosa TaxID=2738883 RepID=A0A6N0HXE3_9GAMM|nr:methyl-accepting chemotaxis protein [Candidatus Reidiella endopervernicosa]QKQ26957.1 MCP four helix bundle domain-containing protein [Candidatus Reidiella endopervernicosa]
MRNVSIKARLIATLLLLSVLMVVIGYMGLHGMGENIAGLESVYKDRVVPLKDLKVIADEYAVNVVDTAHKVRNGNISPDQGVRNVQSAASTINSTWEAYLGTVLVEDEERLVAEIKPLKVIADEHLDELIDFLNRNDMEGLSQWTISDLYDGIDPISEKFGELIAVQLVVAKQVYDDEIVAYEATRNFAIGLIVLGLLAALTVGWILVRAITKPLGIAIEAADAIANGDLTRNVDVVSTDETGQLLSALKTMNEKLHSVVSEVREGTDVIASASNEIAMGNTDLSARTEEQASSLEETASSMEEMTSTVKQNADNARQANQLAASARDQASEGGEVVGNAVAAMAEINTASKKIADIISVIDEIAFQTNLLALNAAVEAARAGEQGRGFAVVAGEVRTLAQRSAEAAKEIKILIEDSVNKVEQGSALVDESGRTLEGIVDSVKKVTDIVSEIAAASSEQASGIDQINNAITQMDDVTQQNAALVEEAAAASKSMEDQASNLISQVSFFNVGGHAASRPKAQNRPTSRPAKRAPAPRSQTEPAAAKADSDDEWEEF